jgi:hypothetical protein
MLLVLYSVLEIANLSPDRVTMGVTTAVFFLVAGGGLCACAFYLQRRSTWARSPIVLAQLIQLGLAWNFRAAPTTWLAVVLAVVALVVLFGIFHPASIRALEGSTEGHDQA